MKEQAKKKKNVGIVNPQPNYRNSIYCPQNVTNEPLQIRICAFSQLNQDFFGENFDIETQIIKEIYFRLKANFTIGNIYPENRFAEKNGLKDDHILVEDNDLEEDISSDNIKVYKPPINFFLTILLNCYEMSIKLY